jgi:FSR family fosmidomycin resistance protein-like MFS transporter
MALLSGGHLAVDFASGAVPALIPYFADRFELSYVEIALVMLAVTVSSSVVQPLFGMWSDRRGALWLVPGGVALAAVGLALACLVPSYGLVVLLVFALGLGVAGFHPEGAKVAMFATARGRAAGMAYFNIGGNLGFALGSVVVGALVATMGLKGGILAALPVFAFSLVLVRSLPYLRMLPLAAAARAEAHGRDRVGAMTVLMSIVALRSVAWFGLLTFVPVWVVAQGETKEDGTRLLSIMLFAGAVGTLVLGHVADRLGLRRTLLVSQAVLSPAVLVFVLVGGVPGTIALAVCGAFVVGTFGITIVLSQLYLPRRVGLASGLAVGLAIGLGGIAAVALGALADAIELRTAMLVSGLVPLGGVLLCFLLPPLDAPRRSGRLPWGGPVLARRGDAHE